MFIAGFAFLFSLWIIGTVFGAGKWALVPLVLAVIVAIKGFMRYMATFGMKSLR